MVPRRTLRIVLACLLAVVLSPLASHASTLEFVDASGAPVSAPYLEGSRAFLRLVDPGASVSVSVAISSLLAADAETVLLGETGTGTGIFEGSIELANGFPASDGRLQTSRDLSHYPWTFDTLTATDGAANAIATTVGSTVEVVDGAGNPATTFEVGEQIHLRVRDALRNTTANPDATTVLLYAVVAGSTEAATVALVETGGDTGVFTGSYQTVLGNSPVQGDGVFECEPGDTITAEHGDANGQTYAVANALAVGPYVPPSFEIVDANEQAIAQLFEFSSLFVRAVVSEAAGAGSLIARVTSTLRGDDELLTLWESTPGVFLGSIGTSATLSTDPPAADGVLELTELAGPPVVFDTVQATLEGCATPPCPSDSVPVIASTLRATDENGADLALAVPGSTIVLEVRDVSYQDPPVAWVTVTTGSGDAETLSLAAVDPYVYPNDPNYKLFRGVLAIEIGTPVVGDGILQVQVPDSLTASHPDPLGLSASTVTLPVASGLVEFLDRTGQPVTYLLTDGDVRVRAFEPAGNLDPGAADTVLATVVSRDPEGNVRDTETLALVETGVSTGLFVGSLPSRMASYPDPQDGQLSTWRTLGGNDTVEVSVGGSTISANLVPGFVRIVDAAGTDVSQVLAGTPLYVELESDSANFSDIYVDQPSVRLQSLGSLDEESLALVETGDDTAIFRGSIPTALSAATPYGGTLEVQIGETIVAEQFSYWGTPTDSATVIASGVNNPPVAADDAVVTPDDVAVSIDVLANDSDPDGQAISVASVSATAAGGTVTIQGAGLLVYTPPAYFTGTDTFTYRLIDSEGAEDFATVTVTVTFVNDPPLAFDDGFGTLEDQQVVVAPTTNDQDPEAEGLTIIAVTPASKGTVTVIDAALGYVRYTPNPNQNGSDSFTYTIADPHGATATATVTIAITPVNDPPIAIDDVLTTAEDTVLSAIVRTNDSDPDGDPIWISSVTQGAHGSVGAGSPDLVYAPAANYNGTDTFTYTINDGNGRTATATVTVTITPVPDPPVAVTDNVTTAEDTAITVDARANDSDPDGSALSITALGTPFHGTAVIDAGGTVTYTPALNYNGTDWFNYTLTDDTGRTASGRINVTITPVNDPPNAVDDSFTMQEDKVGLFGVMANDVDPEGSSLTFVAVTQGAHGLVESFVSSIRYTPAPNFNGTDTFTYTIRDSAGLTDTATVTVTVTPVNDVPTAVADSATTAEDTPLSIPVLANDTDPDGDVLSIFTFFQPAHGTVAAVGGQAVYTPAANYSGPDSFTYFIRDPAGSGSSATVTLTVTPVNDPPIAGDDSAATSEDTAVAIAVLANDSDIDGGALAVTAVTQPVNGVATFTAANVTFTPAANFNGATSFTYTVDDGNGGTATATVSITVTAVNDAPSVGDDSGLVAEDGSVTLSVLGNDSDPDGDALAIAAVTQGAHGTVTFTASAVTYTPAADYNGPDAFTYTVADGNGGSATATVSITVTAVNDAPTAGDDSGSVAEDGSVALAVLDNDADPDGDALTIASATQGAHGTVTFTASTVTYTPASNYNGPDAFTYTISDGNGGSATATVTVAVTAVNDAPSVGDDSGLVAEDGSVTLSVLGNDRDPDGDPLTIASATQGAHGTVTSTASTVTYTPAANYNGPDSFTYTIADGNGGTATATVSITVTAVNDEPSAGDDSGTVAEDGAVTLSVLGNDSDPDGDPLTIAAVTQGAHGTVTFSANTVTYTPASNYNGPDSFTYTIADGNGGTATATVSITVTAVNDAPTAGDDSGSVAEDGAVTLSVLGNDSDSDGDALAITAVSQGTHGTVTFSASGVTYTPAANYNGPDSFTYTIADGNGGSATATVSITVTAVNDAPTAGDDSASTLENLPVVIAVLANDSDADGDALTVQSVTQGALGSVAISGNGTLTYTPNPNVSGADSFTYTVRDTTGLIATASVAVAIVPVNDAPDAVNDAATTDEAGPGVTIAVLTNDVDPDGDPLTVTSVSTPAHGTATRNANNTITYVPATTYSGADSFTYTVSDGLATDTATVSIQVVDVIDRVVVLGTNSVSIQTGADVLSGDVVANQAGSGPFLGSTELAIAGGVTTAADWDVQGNRVTVAAGAVVASDVTSNQLTNGGTITGAQFTPLALPVFATLPTLLTSTPGTTDVNVGTNGTRTLAPGAYRDLIVGKKGTVTLTGGTYHFRSITLSSQAKIFASAASTVRVQQKLSSANLVVIQPGPGSTATAATIVFHVAGANGTTGTLAATPKAVEIGTDNTLQANLYAPNGTLWIKDRTAATGAFLGKDVLIGPDVQVSVASGW